MTKPRFSIAGLMGLVIAIALVTAALRHASPAWESAVFLFTLGSLAVATLGILFACGERRAFWSGFALFAAGYLSLADLTWRGQEVGGGLVTRHAIHEAQKRISGQTLHEFSGKSVDLLMLQALGTVTNTKTSSPTTLELGYEIIDLYGNYTAPPDPTYFHRIGHETFALLLGVAGGMIARWFAAGTEAEQRRSPEEAA